jgi:hypothetical protein
MRYGAIVAGVLILFSASLAGATGWTSPDGKLGFDLPADGSMIEVKNPPPPAVAMWNTADGTGRLLFLTQPYPQTAPLDQAGLERGTLSQLPGGAILSSKRTALRGVPTITIAATGSQKVYVQQTVLAFNGMAYKVIAAGPSKGFVDSHFATVFQSITVLDPAPVIPRAKLSGHDAAIMMSEIGWGVLIVAGVSLAIRRAHRNRSKPPVLP